MTKLVEFDKVIFEHPFKEYQIRLVVSEFKDIEYLHLRKYFLSFDEGYVPTKEGISIPMDITSVYALLDGLLEVVSNTEGMEAVHKHLATKFPNLTEPLN
jgi:hypothetical protein